MAGQVIRVLVGLPGCGKSTWVRERGGVSISSDQLRGIMSDDETNQAIHRRVFKAVRYLLRQRLELGRPVSYVDATNLTPTERRPYITIGRLYGCRVEAIWFDVPVEICKERNRGRTRVVPEDAIDLHAERLVIPSIEEGFDSVVRIPYSSATLETSASNPS